MKKQTVNEWCLVIFGSFLFALAINAFIIPSSLGEGGVAGATIILYYLYEWSPGLVSLLINSVLIIIGYKLLDRHTIFYTILSVASNSFFLHWTKDWSFGTEDLLVQMVFGGVFAGVGIGLVIRAGGTTAGSVILARIANKFLGWNISYALLFFDLIVVFASYFIIGADKMFLTVIMLYIGTVVMEYIIEGLNRQKAVTVITDKPDEVASQVNKDMARGVTVLTGYGYYTKKEKEVLYIVINKRQIVNLKRIIQNTDKEAFVTIHDVRDVFGQGFVDITKA